LSQAQERVSALEESVSELGACACA
jgi:hypothetical protein